VAVRKALGREERDARGVRDAARKEPEQSVEGNALPEGPGRHHGQPSHAEIEAGREDGVMEPGAQLERDPDDGQPPDDAEEGPAPGAPEHAKGERRVGARDQEEDGPVVEHPQDALGAGVGHRVVQGGGEIKEDGGAREDTGPRDVRRSAVAHGASDEDRRTHECGEQADGVTGAVGDLLAACLRPPDGREHGTRATRPSGRP
jgi:hypothetical protein